MFTSIESRPRVLWRLTKIFGMHVHPAAMLGFPHFASSAFLPSFFLPVLALVADEVPPAEAGIPLALATGRAGSGRGGSGGGGGGGGGGFSGAVIGTSE